MTRKITRNDIFIYDSDFDDMTHALQQPQDGLREHPGQPRGLGPQLAQRPPRAEADCLTDWLHNPCLHGEQTELSAFPGSARHGDMMPRALPGVRRAYHPFDQDHRSWRLQCANGAPEDGFRSPWVQLEFFILLKVQPSLMEALLFFECMNAIQRSPILTAWAPTRWMFRLAS